MRLFKKKKDPIVEHTKTLDSKLQKIMDDNPNSFYVSNGDNNTYWGRLIGCRDRTFYKNGDYSRYNLNDIFNLLIKNASYKYSSYDGRTSPDSYDLRNVQRLLDFAKGLIYEMDDMMQEAIDTGCAQYNPKTGKFEFIPPVSKNDDAMKNNG